MDAASQDVVVETRGLSKRFGRVAAVDGVSFALRRGEIYGLLGPNGAGKTTTLRMLAGLARPDAGQASLFGADVRLGPLRPPNRAGWMIEAPGLHPNLSARRNLNLFGRLRGLGGDELRRSVGEALELADLGASADRPVRAYSTGMARKTAIAVAMMGAPDLVVLDEPTSGLDPASVVRLRETLLARRARGTAFLISSHHLSEMETLCTRVAILSSGKLLAEGAPADLRPKGPRRYRLDVNDSAAATLAAAGLPGCRVVEAADAALEVEMEPGLAAALVRLLVERGVEVREVRPARPALEEAYMRLAREPGR